MELLSPSGNYSSALSAFNAGSDAIYIGGKAFSARMSAENFSDEEMIKIINYAHLLNKKVFVTMNTLLYQDEFFKAVEYAEFLYKHNVDGLIIQDIGFAYYLHKVYPELVLHASTQINCHNLAQAKALKKIGFKRVVLAREADISLVKKIKEIGLEVEVFIHGALCVCYSGNCLMSSFIGSRSGNRGRCAQPCRLKYTLCKDNDEIVENYAISTKDLNTLSLVNEYIKNGVDSLKIEGRLKQNEYVYLVTSVYRNAIDKAYFNQINNSLKHDNLELQQMFSRSFTNGYIFSSSPFEVLNQNSSSHQGEVIGVVKSIKNDSISILLSQDVHRLDGIRFLDKYQYGRTIQKMLVNSKDVDIAYKNQIIVIKHFIGKVELNAKVIRTSSYLQLNNIAKLSEINKKLDINGKIYAYKNKPLMFEINGIKKVKSSSIIVEKSLNKPTSKDRIIEQFSKTDQYPLNFKHIDFYGDEDIFIPISEINKLRNEVLLKYDQIINKEKDIIKNEYKFDIDLEHNENVKLNAICLNSKQSNVCKEKNINVFNKENNNLENRINFSLENSLNNKLVHFFIEGNSLIASPYCNITNSYTLDAFYAFGYKECILSSELDVNSIKEIINDYYIRHHKYPNVGLYVYGRYDVMIMKSCPIGTYYHNKNIHCNKCHVNQYYLKDRIGEMFPLIGDENCNTRILDSQILYLLDHEKELINLHVNNFYLNFTLENDLEINKIINNAFNNLDKKDTIFNKDYSSRHYFSRAL